MARNISENIDISGNGAPVRDVANVNMDPNDVEPIAFKELGGGDNVVIADLTSTDLQAAGFSGNIEGRIGAGRGDGQVDRVTVNGMAGSEIITVSSGAGITPIKRHLGAGYNPPCRKRRPAGGQWRRRQRDDRRLERSTGHQHSHARRRRKRRRALRRSSKRAAAQRGAAMMYYLEASPPHH